MGIISAGALLWPHRGVPLNSNVECQRGRMHRLKHIIIVFIILLSCAGCDQATKAIAKEYLPRNEIMSFMSDTVRLQYIENKGGFLSMGDSLPEKTRGLIFTVAAGVIVVLMLCYLLVASSLTPTITIALSLICGGGFGNLIDRILYGGHVIDFLNVGIGDLRTGIFNVADVALMAGAFLILLSGTRHGRNDGF